MEPYKAGITCDDYKVEKFKKELADQGFTEIKVTQLTKGVKLITVHTTPDKKETIRRLCVKLEHGFKRGMN